MQSDCLQPGRNFVTLKVTTEDGIYGLGDATLNGRELAVASYLSDHAIPLLIGRDARRIEDIWQYFIREPTGGVAGHHVLDRRGRYRPLDIKGKALNVPVYQLLGGHRATAFLSTATPTGQASRKQFRPSASTSSSIQGHSRAKRDSRIAKHIRRWTRQVVLRARGKNAPPEDAWSSELYLNFVPRLFDGCGRIWRGSSLLHDVHHRLTPIEAARLGKSSNPFTCSGSKILFRRSCKKVFASSVSTLLLLWRWVKFSTRFTIASNLSRNSSLTTFGPRLCMPGDLTFEEIASLQNLSVRTGCHGATDMSPVCMAAALHFDLSVHNFGIQEFMRHTEETDRVFSHSYSFSDGMMHPGDAPGLGVDLDETLASKYPYQRAYLPVNRKLDGTMHSW